MIKGLHHVTLIKCVKNNKTISKSVCLENRIELASLSEIISLAFCGGSKFLSLLSLSSKIFLNNLSEGLAFGLTELQDLS